MSNVTGKEDISYSKKDVGLTKAPLQSSKTIIFKDERSAGDLVINTASLQMPAEAGSNGFVQPGTATLNALNLLVNRKNLKIHSSRGVWLQEYEDYRVTSGSTIQLIGTIAALGGALEGEVFTVYATPVQAENIITADYKKEYQEYVLAEGETVLNLGREYSTKLNANSQIGTLRVWRNGVGPLLVNVANAAANPAADGNYHMIDDGTGKGTQIEFNDAATGQDDIIVVEFGLEYAGDLSIYGDIESVYGGLLALANDVGPAIGIDPLTWLTANPSQVERRSFGDQVLQNARKLSLVDAPLQSGSWTPIYEAGDSVNVDSSAGGSGFYIRIGNIVMCSLSIVADLTASNAATVISFSGLPFITTFSGTASAQGSFNQLDTVTANDVGGIIEAVTSSAKVALRLRSVTSLGGLNYRGNFFYIIE